MMRETNQEDDSAREVQRIRQVYTRRGSTHRIRLRDDIARPGNRMMVEEARSRLADLLHQHMSRPVREYRILDV